MSEQEIRCAIAAAEQKVRKEVEAIDEERKRVEAMEDGDIKEVARRKLMHREDVAAMHAGELEKMKEYEEARARLSEDELREIEKLLEAISPGDPVRGQDDPIYRPADSIAEGAGGGLLLMEDYRDEGLFFANLEDSVDPGRVRITTADTNVHATVYVCHRAPRMVSSWPQTPSSPWYPWHLPTSHIRDRHTGMCHDLNPTSMNHYFLPCPDASAIMIMHAWSTLVCLLLHGVEPLWPSCDESDRFKSLC